MVLKKLNAKIEIIRKGNQKGLFEKAP